MSGEKTGGSVDYYTARVRQESTVDGRDGYTVQCLEVIETLGMTFAEGEAFKAIWRSCAARTLGKLKADNDARYNAEKVVFYGGRMLKAASCGPIGLEAGEWKEWRGGWPPVKEGTRIDVKDYDGTIHLNASAGDVNTGDRYWLHNCDSNSKIVAWRYSRLDSMTVTL